MERDGESFSAAGAGDLPGTPEIRKGYLYGNHKPGLGIDINEELVAKYPIGQSRDGGAYGTERGVDATIITATGVSRGNEERGS